MLLRSYCAEPQEILNDGLSNDPVQRAGARHSLTLLLAKCELLKPNTYVVLLHKDQVSNTLK